MTEHTKMPSERAMRVAGAINITITEDGLGHRNDLITSDDIADIISSEYADLEAYVEYVETLLKFNRDERNTFRVPTRNFLLFTEFWEKKHK